MRLPTAPRLTFREMADADLDDIAALLGDEAVMRFYPKPKTRGEASDWITRNQRRYRAHGFGLWVITLRDSGEFIGDCGLTFQHVDGVDELRSSITSAPVCRAVVTPPKPQRLPVILPGTCLPPIG